VVWNVGFSPHFSSGCLPVSEWKGICNM